MSNFTVDPDIRKARTLSSEFYTDPRYFELSKERIFARTWQYIGSDDGRHDLTPVTILENFLDEPALLVRNTGSLRLLSNVCTHRGKVIIDEPCSAKLIRCPYHGRRFSLDGKFLSMPEFDDVIDFPGENDNLAEIPLAERARFLFASIDPCASFEEFVREPAERLDDIEPVEFRLASTRDYEVNAHWALYCENYLEGFHIPFVHESLNKIVDFGTYNTELFRYSSLQTGLDSEGRFAGRYLFIFPNTMFNFYDWGVSVNVVRPVSAGKSVVTFFTYVPKDGRIENDPDAELERIELEDEAVVESVQKGIRSRFYSSGRYSPTREQGTHHFHRLIAEFMG